MNLPFLKKLRHVILNIFSFVLVLIVVIPFYVVLINSFKTSTESNRMSINFPSSFHFENYATVIEKGKLFTSFNNSLLYSVVSVCIIVICVLAAAFVISRNTKGINKVFYYFIITGLAMPINNVSLFKVMQFLNLMNTRIGIILIYSAVNIPLSLFIAYGFIATIPKELDEAAILDGCSPLQLFMKIIIPLLKPIASTLAVLNMMAVWNDFTMPLYYLNNSKKWPMTLAVYNFFGAFENSWNLVCADIVLTIVPVLLVFIFGQKYIVGGVSAGAVKG